MGDGSAARLQVSVGASSLRKTAEAAPEATAALREPGDPISLVLVYASEKHDHRRLLAEVASAAPGAPVLGCTTTGELSSRGVLDEGLVVVGLRSAALRVGVGHGEHVFERPGDAATEAVARAREQLGRAPGSGGTNRVCLVHTAGFTLSQRGVEEPVLEALQAALGAGWTIVGGSAGDGARFLGSHQFAGESVLAGSVVVALIETDLRVTHGMAHGFVPDGRRFRITEAEGAVVKRIEGKLALDFYADLLGIKPDRLTKGMSLVRLTDKLPRFLSAFGQNVGLTPQLIMEKIPFFGYAIEHPFGIRTAGGVCVPRVPKVITPQGFLEFHARMDQSPELELMKLDPELTRDAPARAIAGLRNGGADPALVLVYECSGRYLYLQKELGPLFDRIRGATTAELAGFFSSAEQGVLPGVGCGSYSYTTSVLGLG